ncbi:MAG: hypothetical protein WBQ17_17670 [Rhizomicrobium sp.]
MTTTLHFPVSVDVPLREKRTYLHSTNLFDHLVARTGARQNLSLAFRRKIECQVEALSAADCEDADAFPARFSGETANGSVDLVLREKQPLTPISWREPYNENAAAYDAVIEGATVSSDKGNGASLIERIVSLNKRLLTEISEGKKMLVFSKINLKSLPDKRARLKIHLKSRLGFKLFRSAIFANDEEVGEIIFYGT